MKILLSFITNWSEPFSYLLFLISALLYFQHDKTNKIKVLLFYYTIAFGLMLVGSYFVHLEKSNLWIYNTLFFITSICIPYYFLQVITATRKQLIIKICMYTTSSYLLIKVLFFKGLFTFMSFEYALVYITIVLMVLMYFHQILKNVNEEKILLNFNFWICTGWLLNFLGGFFVILSYSYLSNKIYQNKLPDTLLVKERTLLTDLWAFPNMLLLLSAIILIFGTLWITYQKKLR